MRAKGFTLIELLIVIAIIAILALIAIPNFLEAQTRAKVSRIHADLRTAATGLEAYFVDYNKYPYYFNNNDGIVYGYSDATAEATFIPYRLTTPIAYLTSLVETPFQVKPDDPSTDLGARPYTYFYRYAWPFPPNEWQPYPGPGNRPANATYDVEHARRAAHVNMAYDCYNHQGYFLDPSRESNVAMWLLASPGPNRHCETIQRASSPQYAHVGGDPDWPDLRYDPTNGTVSIGDVCRFNAMK